MVFFRRCQSALIYHTPIHRNPVSVDWGVADVQQVDKIKKMLIIKAN